MKKAPAVAGRGLFRAPLSGALPKAPSLTLPVMVSPEAVASNSSVMGMGWVMALDQVSVSPETVPEMSASPCGPRSCR